MKEFRLPKGTGERIRAEAVELLEFCTGLPANEGLSTQAAHEPKIIRTAEQIRTEQERSADELTEFCTGLSANEGLSTQAAPEPQEIIRTAESGTKEKETVYIAGKITGDPCYFSKFYAADQKLKAAGFIVLDPAMLPGEGFSHEAYMHMTTAMLDECSAVCFLPDWKESRGAIFEHARAAVLGKRIFYFDEWKEAMPE